MFCFSLGTNCCAKAFFVCDKTPADTNFNSFFVELFGDNIARKAAKNEYVYVSGAALGFCVQGDGAVVIAVGDVESEIGGVSPCDGQDILPGDIIICINNTKISSASDIEKIINDGSGADERYEITILRNKKRYIKHIVPAIDEGGTKRLGLWIRDNLAGIGTLTFVTEKNRFGALGHTVCDADTGTCMPVYDGQMYCCNVVGVTKGKKGVAGELKGVFARGNSKLGTISKNNEFGLYGEYCGDMDCALTKMAVASQNEIHPGKAYILSTIEGTTPKKYDIEIIKVNTQASQKAKSLVLRVTDNELIEKTGGIVQGMSGSPIIQDNKFVGAVTHVFVSDPTKGYGVYAQWMLEQ